VTPAAATHFVVSGYPASVVAGVSHNVTVTAKDAYGNTATGYGGTVAITSSDSAAVLPSESALTDGQRTFSVTLETVGSGTQTIMATDDSDATITGTSDPIPVDPAAATHFVVSGYPASVVAA